MSEISGKLKHIIDDALTEKYGQDPGLVLHQRTNEEWEAIQRCGMIVDVAALYELSALFKKNRCPYLIHGNPGSSFILYLLGITTGNPLPAHYYCPECKSVKWEFDYKDGFDLPQNATCPDDHEPLIPDGHNIPWQTVWGYDNSPRNICIVLHAWPFEQFKQELSAHWLTDFFPDCFMINPYPNQNDTILLSNISLQFFWSDEDISPDFYDRSFCASDRNLILSQWKSLVCGESEEFDNIPEPINFSDVLSAFGVVNSAGAWDYVAEFMIYQMEYSLSDLIAFRDDIFFYLRDHGISPKEAWRGMDHVRRGKDCPVMTKEILQARDKWVVDRIKRIRFLFPKADAVEYIAFQLKAYSDF